MSRLVRLATPGDAAVIGEVAAAAWRDTYTGLLRQETIRSFVEAAYAPNAVNRRIERDTFLVAEVDGIIRAFADAVPNDSHLVLAAIYAEPSWRRHGLGQELLAELLRRFPDVAVSADVLVGNRIGEAFYERHGFAPGDLIETDLFGEHVQERRWWLGQPPAERGHRAPIPGGPRADPGGGHTRRSARPLG